MKRALIKDIFRELRKTRSRFLSILVMVMLASMFLCGLRSASPDMQLTADRYYDRQRLMDLRVVSTLGLVDDDVAALAAAEGVACAEGAYTLDALALAEDADVLVRLHSYSDRVNVPVLVEGRLPEAADECAVEQKLLDRMQLRVGDQIAFGGNEDLADQLAAQRFTITGVVESPYYIGLNRGTASIADGAVDCFAVLPRAAFTMEYYTEIYLLASDASGLLCYDEDYDALLDTLRETVEPLAEAQVELRYQRIVSDAQAAIDDAVAELNNGKAEMDAKEADARAELADARAELDQGWADYAAAQEEYDAEIADAEARLAEAAQTLENNRQLIAQNEQTLNTDRQSLLAQEAEAEAQLAEAENTLAENKAQLDEGEAQYRQGLADYEAGLAALEDARAQLEELRRQQAELASMGQLSIVVETGIRSLEATIAQSEPEVTAAAEELAATREQLDAAQAAYEAGTEELAATREQTTAQLEDAWAMIQYGERQISSAKQALAQGEQDYDSGLAELEQAREDGRQQLADAQAELEQGETDYADGLAELEDQLADARAELSDGQREIDDARAELAGLERGKLYLLDRGTSVPNYVGYEQDSDRMNALSNVFPVLFFVVAGLVCLTTMTRMVEEQRTQIGVLKAVGYGTWPVAQKFLIYGCLAAAIGTVIGCIAGTYFLPWVICTCYGVMYTLPAPELPWHWLICAEVAAASLGGTVAAVLWAVWTSVIRPPAELMRPRAPQAGKRILLERIGPLWRRLNFSAKVSARNLLRYQKRFWMTVIGVSGCTALIIAGFGLQEGIMSVIDRQFGVIYAFDLQVTLDDTATEARREEVIEGIVSGGETDSSAVAQFSTVTFHGETRSEEGFLAAAQDTDEFLRQFILRDYDTGERLTLPEEGCVVTEKLMELLHLSVGDEIVVETDRRVSIPIVASCEQYVQHYVYLSASAYAKAFGEPPARDTVFVTLHDHSDEALSAYTERLLTQPAVMAVTNLNATGRSFRDTMSVVNYVVLIIIFAAATLAFVVQYNLTNINITERLRELATLKVLGFFDLDLAMYVYRENIVLTILGIALGQLFGCFLSAYMVRTIEIDMVMFGRQATWVSYVWSIGLSLLFALLVNLAMYYRLKKIDMVESLKSVE